MGQIEVSKISMAFLQFPEFKHNFQKLFGHIQNFQELLGSHDINKSLYLLKNPGNV